jgi:hypothetical protein
MTNPATTDLISRLEARVIDLENRLAKYEKPERPTPPTAPQYPDGHTTVEYVKNPIVLPTADELRRLEEIVLHRYKKLRAGSDPAGFRASFHRLSYVRRAEKLDTKHSLDWRVGEAEDWLRAQHYYPSRPALQSFAAAAIAMGDIGFSDPAKFPSMSLGLTGLTQFEPLSGRWRQVLESGQAPLPAPDQQHAVIRG